MSAHYEVVVSCFLRDGTPEPVLAALRWHLGLEDGPPPDGAADGDAYPLLEPDPHSPLPGGDVASLRLQDEGWGLNARNHWLDDDLGELAPLLDLIAPHVARPGHGGHFRERYEAAPTVFAFHDGTHELLRDPA